jgi:hypothetical protein
MMAMSYRIVKYCRACKKRYLVEKGESKKNYCEDCHENVQKYFAKKAEKEEQEEKEKEEKQKKQDQKD